MPRREGVSGRCGGRRIGRAGGAAAGWVLDAAGVNHTLAVGVQLELPVQPVQLWLAMADAARE